jgi:hypothetical protein
MSYCRFENTYNDIKECLIAMENEYELSDSEQYYKEKLIKLCTSISEHFDEDRDGDYEDDNIK